MSKPSGITFLGIPENTYTEKIADNKDMISLLGKTDGTLNFIDTGAEGISLNDAFILGNTSTEVLEYVGELLSDDSRFNSK